MPNTTLIVELKLLIKSLLNTYSFSKNKEQAILRSIISILGEDMNIESNNTIAADIFQHQMASLNERTSKRKTNGVFYTNDDVVEYIVGNAFLNFIFDDTQNVYPIDICLEQITRAEDKLINKLQKASIFDPTCGTGQFLISALEVKINILRKKEIVNDELLLQTISTIHGNDIDEFSIKITMVRILFYAISLLEDINSYKKVVSLLKENFMNVDYVQPVNVQKHYDIVIGNPPYIEYRKLESKPTILLGNTYANVLHNTIFQLARDGVMAYIIPLSFVATPRMKRIRNEVMDSSKKMITINFSDRPDCLFSSVHQKLTVLIALRGEEVCRNFCSNYYYWYKSERKRLFDNCVIYPSSYEFDGFIPKIGNEIEKSIFDKVIRGTNDPKLTDFLCHGKGNAYVYINMRGTFWMKSFKKKPDSREYNKFCFSKEMQPYIICILNSSLFFFYWIVISDCWHITNKELGNFKIRTDFDLTIFKPLCKKLLDKLERTKIYIGTKQCDYEYKHKYCKGEIDAIDNALANIYKLTTKELDYIKTYQLKYRMSDGKK